MMARSLRSLWNAAIRPEDLPTDAELLTRFTTGDPSAFELLVRRHAAAVWAACRGILRNDTDADDAAQVTFFTLARHARRVKAGANLGGWLHRVAVNAALKLRAKRRPNTALPDVPVSPSVADDSAAVLHEELTRLPAAYREVLVAVDLEGYGHADAAKVLGWPVGTVSGRVVRARAELRRRLERRGVTATVVVAGGVGGVATHNAIGGSSIRAAVEVAVGAVVASPEVVSLSTEVWAMIATAKRKLAAVAMAGVFGLFVLGGVAAVAQVPGAPPSGAPGGFAPPAVPPLRIPNGNGPQLLAGMKDLPAVVAAADDSPEVKLGKEIMRAELDRLRVIDTRIDAGQFSGATTFGQLPEALADLTAAAEEVFAQPKDQLPWFEFRAAVLKRAEKYIEPRTDTGVEDPQVFPHVRAERAKAELALVKVQKKTKK